MKTFQNIQRQLTRIPSPIYLGIAVLIFAASASVTRKIMEIGQAHTVNGHNPISLCNVLFVGNLCALALMIPIFYKDWNPSILQTLTRKNWIILTITGTLSGAIAPALIFSALGLTMVTNIVLVGQIAPILTLALGIFFLGSPVNPWTIAGSLVSFGGIALTIFLGNSGQGIAMPGFRIGLGEIFVLIASVIGASNNVISRLQLQSIPLGIFTIYSNILGTIIFFLLANILYGPSHFTEVFSPFLWQWMIIYALVIVVLGKLCWLAGLKKASATELNVASLLNPILAIMMAYLILGEVPTSAQYIGGSLLLVGVILSFVGNLYQINANEKPAIPSSRDAMETNVGFRGV